MKNLSPTLQAYLDSSSIRLSTCLKISAQDGTILGFTNFTRDITFEGVIYKATTGQTPTAVSSSASLSVDNLDIETLRSIDAITGPDILKGRYDFADVRIFILNPDDISAGALKVRRGWVGQVSLSRQKLTAEIRGIMDALTKQILDIYSPGCRVNLGSSACGVPLDPSFWAPNTAYTVRKPFDAMVGSIIKPTAENDRFFECTVSGVSGGIEPAWDTTLGNTTVDGAATWKAIQAYTVTGTVSEIINTKRSFHSDRLEATDYFTGGLLTWLTGLNAGASMEVKSYVVAFGRFDLILPMWLDVAINDTFSVHAGCFKRLEDCRDKFNNTKNFQGEPHVQQNFTISPSRVDQNAGGK